ncbi:MAG: hypothetical protein F6J93_20510 [Oscillatoria sp. SIO1A7]|nr:hypothetical protein [Oscillatoria sp. SIO1A7]
MLKKTPFVLVCLLSGAIVAGSPAKAGENPKTGREINTVPHSNFRTPSITHASYFQNKESKVALAKQPPIIELASADRDFSQVILTNRDLPAGFQAMPPTDMEKLRQDLNQDDFKVESLFAFADQNNFEVVMGITTSINSEQDRAEFDEALNKPEVLQALLTQGLGETRVLEKEPLEALDNIGEAVGGTSLKVNLENIPARLDIVAFRRDIIGAFVFVMYLDGDTPALSIADVARQLDVRAEGVLSSDSN